MTNKFQTGDRVKLVGNPQLTTRFFGFSALIGTIFTFTGEVSEREHGDHQYRVARGSFSCYFFGSELKKIDE